MSRTKSKKKTGKRKNRPQSPRSAKPVDGNDSHVLGAGAKRKALESEKKACIALLEKDIQRGHVWHRLGLIYYRVGQLTEAIECMSIAQPLVQPSPSFFTDFGAILAEASEEEAANQYFVAALTTMEAQLQNQKAIESTKSKAEVAATESELTQPTID